MPKIITWNVNACNDLYMLYDTQKKEEIYNKLNDILIMGIDIITIQGLPDMILGPIGMVIKYYNYIYPILINLMYIEGILWSYILCLIYTTIPEMWIHSLLSDMDSIADIYDYNICKMSTYGVCSGLITLTHTSMGNTRQICKNIPYIYTKYTMYQLIQLKTDMYTLFISNLDMTKFDRIYGNIQTHHTIVAQNVARSFNECIVDNTNKAYYIICGNFGIKHTAHNKYLVSFLNTLSIVLLNTRICGIDLLMGYIYHILDTPLDSPVDQLSYIVPSNHINIKQYTGIQVPGKSRAHVMWFRW